MPSPLSDSVRLCRLLAPNELQWSPNGRKNAGCTHFNVRFQILWYVTQVHVGAIVAVHAIDALRHTERFLFDGLLFGWQVGRQSAGSCDAA